MTELLYTQDTNLFSWQKCVDWKFSFFCYSTEIYLLNAKCVKNTVVILMVPEDFLCEIMHRNIICDYNSFSYKLLYYVIIIKAIWLFFYNFKNL